MKTSKDLANELIDFTYSSPTSFHAVQNVKNTLLKSKFVELDEAKKWKLKSGGKYFIIRNNSALVAFIVGLNKPSNTGIRIVGAHTDSPCFRIKPTPEMIAENKYFKLNTEVYGGPILNTWLDRPLSIAGRVTLATDDVMNPRIELVNINRPICIIPNISIHMNPELNSGYKLNKQIDMLPLLGNVNSKLETKGYLQKLVAKELRVSHKQIIDFDLFLYEHARGSLTGVDDQLISASRLDDLEAVNAGINAITSLKKPKVTCVVSCFDNEEVGSATRQGADSQMLSSIIERIVISTGGSREDFFRALSKSFIVSADGAHAVHPNAGTKCDPSNRPGLNSGIAIKMSANKSYTSDAQSIAIFKQICSDNNIDTQIFVNRSDMRGGSTIGPISSTHLDIASIDVGIPMLAMHSIRELCGVKDHISMIKALTSFFKA